MINPENNTEDAESPHSSQDPLNNPALKPPGILEKLREAFLGQGRPLNCVQIEVTSCCLGKCVYCPHTTQAQNWRSRHMKAETFAAIWPLLRHSSRAHLQGWGEPFLHPRFFDFVETASRAGCQVSTTSCGLVLDEHIADQIVHSGMDMLAFSFVGVDSKSNGARQGVDFEQVCRNIKYLRQKILRSGVENPPQLHLAYLMLADRMDAVERLPELMDELDVQAAVVSTLDYLAYPTQKELAFSPNENDKIEKARTILEKASERTLTAGRSLYYALPGSGKEPQPGGCRENVTHSLYVDADGQVSPCVYLNVPGNDPPGARLVLGNVRQENGWQIWNKKEFCSFRDFMRGGKTPAQCMRCPKRYEISA